MEMGRSPFEDRAMQPSAPNPQATFHPDPLSNEIEIVVDVRVEPRDGRPALVVVKQTVRLESARIAAVGGAREEVRPLP